MVSMAVERDTIITIFIIIIIIGILPLSHLPSFSPSPSSSLPSLPLRPPSPLQRRDTNHKNKPLAAFVKVSGGGGEINRRKGKRERNRRLLREETPMSEFVKLHSFMHCCFFHHFLFRYSFVIHFFSLLFTHFRLLFIHFWLLFIAIHSLTLGCYSFRL